MNHIDQRNTNRRDTNCPVFWRRVGIPLTRFLAFYPWATMILLGSVDVFLPVGGMIAPVYEKALVAFLIIVASGHFLLLLPALLWHLRVFVAAYQGLLREGRRGASLRVWFAYSTLWFSGYFVSFLLFWHFWYT